MVALETTATSSEDDVERALAAWLARAGTCDRAETEARLRFARVVIGRLDVGFARDAWAFDRFRDHKTEEPTVDWMRRELHMSVNAANSALDVGLFADELPKSVVAVEEGRIGFAHLSGIASVKETAARMPVDIPGGELVMEGDVRPPSWTEDWLLEKAQKQTIGKFITTCQAVQHELDADSVTRRLRAQMEAQRVSLWRTSDGSYRIHGWLDGDNGVALKTALEPLAAPRDAHDKRPYGNRVAEALGELAQIGLDAGKVGTVGGVRPHISIVAGADTLALLEGAAVVYADVGGLLPDHVARRLACDATVSRVLLDSKSMPIDVGREVRVVPPALRRALTVRDRGCRWPTCSVPPARCHAHHIDHWIDGGETSRANCILLCRRHHRLLHEGMWELEGEANGEISVRERAEPARHGDRSYNWLRAIEDCGDYVPTGDAEDALGCAPEASAGDEPGLGPDGESGETSEVATIRTMAWELAWLRAEAARPPDTS